MEELISEQLLVDKKYMVLISLSYNEKLIDSGFAPACESACAYLAGAGSSSFSADRAFDCVGGYSKTLRHLLLSLLPEIFDKNASLDSGNVFDCAFGLFPNLIPQVSAYSQ